MPARSQPRRLPRIRTLPERWALVLLALCAFHPAATDRSTAAEPYPLQLPALFSDHMILQRDLPLRVWGRAVPGAPIRVELAGESGEAVAAPDGRWSVTLGAQAAGGPYEMKVTEGKGGASLVFSDVLVGDVWLCSGQSNMERPVNSEKDPGKTLAAADRPRIRVFLAKPTLATEPQTDLSGQWEVCTPETVGAHSAIGYHFLCRMQESLGEVPVGMIEAAWSSRGAECFMAREWLEADPRLKPVLAATDRAAGEFEKKLAAWEERGSRGR